MANLLNSETSWRKPVAMASREKLQIADSHAFEIARPRSHNHINVVE